MSVVGIKCGEIIRYADRVEYICDECNVCIPLPFDLLAHVQSHQCAAYPTYDEKKTEPHFEEDNYALKTNSPTSILPDDDHHHHSQDESEDDTNKIDLQPLHKFDTSDAETWTGSAVVADSIPTHPPDNIADSIATNEATVAEVVSLRRTMPRYTAPKAFTVAKGVQIPKKIVCDICGARMSFRFQILAHMECHLNKQAHKCSDCPKTFNTRRALMKHTRIIHRNIAKRYNCEQCGWLFHEKCGLNQHMLKHTGERPFACKVCDKRFNQSSYLNIHMRTHSGERPYRCEKCAVGFTSQNMLTRHIRRHRDDRGYKCDECNESFFNLQPLREHKRTHEGDRPFKCDMCDKTFTRRNNYTSHMNAQHNGVRLACRWCDQTFAHRSSRTTHENQKHGKCVS